MFRFVLVFLVLFLVSCSSVFSLYSVSPNTKPDKIVVSKITPHTGKTRIFVSDRTINPIIYDDGKNLYVWEKEDNYFIVYGILQKYEKYFTKENLDSFLSHMKKYKATKYNNYGYNYYIFIPKYNLYIKTYKTKTGHIIFEYTDNYQNDSSAKRLNGKRNIEKELEKFRDYYNLKDITYDYIKWIPDNDNNTQHVSGNGTIFSYIPNTNSSAKLYISGNFNNGLLVGKANLKIAMHSCIDPGIIFCKKHYDGVYEKNDIDPNKLVDWVNKGLEKLDNEKYEEQKQLDYQEKSKQTQDFIKIDDCRPSNNGSTMCTLYINGNYDGSIFYTVKSDGRYPIYIMGSKNAKNYTHGHYDTNLHNIYTTDCGSSPSGSVNSISKALYKFTECAINGRY